MDVGLLQVLACQFGTKQWFFFSFFLVLIFQEIVIFFLKVLIAKDSLPSSHRLVFQRAT